MFLPTTLLLASDPALFSSQHPVIDREGGKSEDADPASAAAVAKYEAHTYKYKMISHVGIHIMFATSEFTQLQRCIQEPAIAVWDCFKALQCHSLLNMER